MSAPANNYLMQGINASVRIAFVIVPTMKAGTHLVELASRVINAGLRLINIEVKMPAVINQGDDPDKASYASQFYTKIHKYLPASITTQNDAFNRLSTADVIKGTLFYTTVAVVATFAANKLIGPMPEAYNTIAKYAGSILRFDRSYDLIQMGLNYYAGRK